MHHAFDTTGGFQAEVCPFLALHLSRAEASEFKNHYIPASNALIHKQNDLAKNEETDIPCLLQDLEMKRGCPRLSRPIRPRTSPSAPWRQPEACGSPGLSRLLQPWASHQFHGQKHHGGPRHKRVSTSCPSFSKLHFQKFDVTGSPAATQLQLGINSDYLERNIFWSEYDCLTSYL